MYQPRLIPCLLLDGRRLVKTMKFSKPSYVGDPVNTVKIFNEKEVDELIVLDITASKEGRRPEFAYIQSLASECFMPVCYGGGVRTLGDAQMLFSCGVEKVSINTAALESLALIGEIAKRYGSQSVVVGIDVKKHWLKGTRVWNNTASSETKHTPAQWASTVEAAGAGEILLNNVDRDGTLLGFDIELIKSVTDAVHVPVVACGGASSLVDCKSAITFARASAAAAGALFVYRGPHRAVLINYPDPQQLQHLFQPK